MNATTGKRTALIAAGIPGHGGEITFGDGAVWATVLDYPITRIDPATNTVSGQWHGEGGDSIRIGHGSLWLSNRGAKGLATARSQRVVAEMGRDLDGLEDWHLAAEPA